MADIMKQRRNPQEFFNIIDGWNLRKFSRKKWIEVAREATCHVHGAERVDKAAMLGGWIDPSRTLELENVAKALDPWRIDQIFFGPLGRVRRRIRNRERDIFVDRIGDQRRSIIEGRLHKIMGFHKAGRCDVRSILPQISQVGNRSSTECRCARYRQISQ